MNAPTVTPTAGLRAVPDPFLAGSWDIVDADGRWYGAATDACCDAATAEANARLWAGAHRIWLALTGLHRSMILATPAEQEAAFEEAGAAIGCVMPEMTGATDGE